jgi:hypothetical protein
MLLAGHEIPALPIARLLGSCAHPMHLVAFSFSYMHKLMEFAV